METTEGQDNPIEKEPLILYHGSPDKNIETFYPGKNKAVTERGELKGVRATPHKTLAAAFVREKCCPVTIGSFDHDKTWFIVVSDKDKFLKSDRGGTIYSFSPENFTFNPSLLGKSEYITSVAVRPTRKEEYSSSLEAMLNAGVQVYLLTPKLYEEFEATKGDKRKEIEF